MSQTGKAVRTCSTMAATDLADLLRRQGCDFVDCAYVTLRGRDATRADRERLLDRLLAECIGGVLHWRAA